MKNVENLKGIELFPYLMHLNCTGITTETVDLSNLQTVRNLIGFRLQGSFKNLILPSNSVSNYIEELVVDAPLTSFNIPANYSHLRYIRLDNSNLTTIDLSNLKPGNNRYEIGIYNPQKQITVIPPSVNANNSEGVNLSIVNSVNTSFDFSNFNEVDGLHLFLKDNSSLTSLTLPTNKSILKVLSLHDNPLLTSLNVDDYTALEALSYGGNGFKSVNVTENTSLKLLECNGNELISLDLSNNTELTHLYCQDNLLTSLDLSNNTDLRALECYNNQLTELDLSNNTKLKTQYGESGDIWGTFSRRGTSLWEMTGIEGTVTGCMEFVFREDDTESYTEGIVVFPSISLSPQKLGKDYVAIDGRSKLGVQCNTNDGVLTSYGTYSAVTSSDDDNNYIVVGNGTTDVHAYRDTVRYSYNTGYTGDYDEAKTMAVKIGTSAHGMYVHPETKTTEYDNSYNGFYWGTLYLEFPARIPDGVQCYYAKNLDVNENLANLTEVTGTIPANTAVIVKAPTEPKFFAFNESDVSPDAPDDNIMAGTIEVLPVAKRSVLTLGFNVSNQDGEKGQFGFWDYLGTKINPFRAYVPKSNLPAGAKGGFSIVFPGDDTNGIARLTNDGAVQDGTWFTLSGVRINGRPTAKGIYVNGGKKVVIK